MRLLLWRRGSLSGSGWNTDSSGDSGQMPAWWLMVFSGPSFSTPFTRVQDTCPVPHTLISCIIPALDKQWHTIITHTTIKHSYMLVEKFHWREKIICWNSICNTQLCFWHKIFEFLKQYTFQSLLCFLVERNLAMKCEMKGWKNATKI